MPNSTLKKSSIWYEISYLSNFTKNINWFHKIFNNKNELRAAFGKISKEESHNFVLYFYPGIYFIIDKKDKKIICVCNESSSHYKKSDEQVLLVSQVIPLALSLENILILHASSIIINGMAYAFLGGDGYGKSTLTGHFHKNNFTILGDDILALEWHPLRKKFMALPSYPEIRLYPNHARKIYKKTVIKKSILGLEKNRIFINQNFSKKSVPLKTIFFLDKKHGQKKIKLSALLPQKALIAILRNSLRLDIQNNKILEKEMIQLALMENRILFFELSYPRKLSALDSVIEIVSNYK